MSRYKCNTCILYMIKRYLLQSWANEWQNEKWTSYMVSSESELQTTVFIDWFHQFYKNIGEKYNKCQ